jgi:hypothetical protein
VERKVVVEGSRIDLDRAVQSLAGKDVRIVAEDGGYFLVAPEIDNAENAAEARSAADPLLAELHGLLRLEWNPVAKLTAGSVVEIRDDGGRQVHGFVFAQAAVAVVAVGIPTVAGGTPGATPIRALDVGLARRADAEVALVLRLLSDGDTWANLYKIIDQIGSAEGGKKGLIRHGWIDERTLERITLTANAIEKALDGGRHALPTYSLGAASLPEIGLDEAAEAVKGLVRAWLASRQ